MAGETCHGLVRVQVMFCNDEGQTTSNFFADSCNKKGVLGGATHQRAHVITRFSEATQPV